MIHFTPKPKTAVANFDVPALFPTIEAFAQAYIESTCLEFKCRPPAPPNAFAPSPIPRDLRPGRPSELRVTEKRPRSEKRGAMIHPHVRAAVHHKFWHHELQAAELMCWAILRFPEAPEEFRRGLLKIFRDEVRHMSLYEAHLLRLGGRLGDFEVRDWFWERVPTCQTPLQFVALLGMGLEGANLEHTARFSTWFRSFGDHQAADIQDQVGREEVAHVRFATKWFRIWTGDVSFEEWVAHLPPPLSPLLMKGKSLHLERRKKAAFPETFTHALSVWRAE